MGPSSTLWHSDTVCGLPHKAGVLPPLGWSPPHRAAAAGDAAANDADGRYHRCPRQTKTMMMTGEHTDVLEAPRRPPSSGDSRIPVITTKHADGSTTISINHAIVDDGGSFYNFPPPRVSYEPVVPVTHRRHSFTQSYVPWSSSSSPECYANRSNPLPTQQWPNQKGDAEPDSFATMIDPPSTGRRTTLDSLERSGVNQRGSSYNDLQPVDSSANINSPDDEKDVTMNKMKSPTTMAFARMLGAGTTRNRIFTKE